MQRGGSVSYDEVKRFMTSFHPHEYSTWQQVANQNKYKCEIGWVIKRLFIGTCVAKKNKLANYLMGYLGHFPNMLRKLFLSKSKRSFYGLCYPLPPVFFSPCTKFLSVHILNMLFKHAILYRITEALENVQKLALKFVKCLRHVPHVAALQELRLFPLTHRQIRGDLISMVCWNSPWSSPSPT